MFNDICIQIEKLFLNPEASQIARQITKSCNFSCHLGKLKRYKVFKILLPQVLRKTGKYALIIFNGDHFSLKFWGQEKKFRDHKKAT